jgi:hypothetical protein
MDDNSSTDVECIWFCFGTDRIVVLAREQGPDDSFVVGFVANSRFWGMAASGAKRPFIHERHLVADDE